MTTGHSRASAVLLGAALCIALGAATVVLLTTEDGRALRAASQADGAGGDLELERHLPLSPVLVEAGNESSGTAFVVRPKGQRRLNVVVRARLPPSAGDEAYEAWLYNSVSDAKSLGTLVKTKGDLFQEEAPLPGGYFKRWRYIDISRERIPRNVKDARREKNHSGASVLRGTLAP